MRGGEADCVLFSPPPCGEGSGVGVAPEEAKGTPPYARGQRSILSHPHPYPPRKGEGAETSRVSRWGDAL